MLFVEGRCYTFYYKILSVIVKFCSKAVTSKKRKDKIEEYNIDLLELSAIYLISSPTAFHSVDTYYEKH